MPKESGKWESSTVRRCLLTFIAAIVLGLILKACRRMQIDRQKGNNMSQGNDKRARLSYRCIAKDGYGHEWECVWVEMVEILAIQCRARWPQYRLVAFGNGNH